MFRKYVIVTLAAVFFMGTAACTSKKAEDDSADVESASDDGLELADATENNSDLNTGDSAAPADTAAASELNDLGGDELAADEKLPEDSGPAVSDAGTSELAPTDLAETPPADAPMGDMPPADPGMGDSAPPDTLAANDAPPPEPEPSAPATPEPSFTDTAPPAPAVGSLKKAKTTPWKEGKTLLNAIYVARKGDSVKAISQKVFGTPDRVKEICRHNSYNCSRSVKVGDKFYYNSPQRPTDDTAVKTFYEDAGIQPEIYTAKAGDNIRKVGKELLGDSRSWMELWALNDVESKGDLDEGTQLRYWPNSEVAAPAQTIADNSGNTAPPPADAGMTADPNAGMTPPPAEGEMPVDPNAPPPTDMAATDPNAVPPPPADMGVPPPPPPSDLPPAPDANMAGSVEPPPPPPPPPPTDSAGAAAGLDPNDPSQTMPLAVGAILLLAAAALFISIRKRKQRRAIDFNTTTQTQIE